MADLKNTLDRYLVQLAEREAECHEIIARAAKEAVDSIKTCMDAGQRLPVKTSDLLELATVALVKDVEILAFDDPHRGNSCYANFSVGSDFSLNDRGGEGPKVKSGRYRALFFLLPLPEESK